MKLLLLDSWVWNPLAAASALAALLLYACLFGWSRRAAWMGAACAVFLFTLMSPLAYLAQGTLFSAHMAQHILLLLIVPALALLSLPPSVRLPGGLHPAVSWACGAGAMWLWHVPVLCDAAAVSRPVSALQTGSLLLLGAAFWWQVLAPSPGQRLRPLQGVAYLFAGCVACSVLGIIFTFAPVTVCKAYAGYPVERFGITPLRDQQIGGLIMWVPMCLVYLCAIFMQLARWYSPGPHFSTTTTTTT